MKKIVLLLLAGLLMTPSELFAEHYKCKKMALANIPVRTPSQYFISLILDENTGDLVIAPNHSITDLHIMITSNGVTYLNTTVSLSFGQSYTDCLNYLGVGTYLLTLIIDDEIIDQYEITVEDD